MARRLVGFIAAMLERAFDHHAGTLFEMRDGRLDQRLVPDHDRMEVTAFLALAVSVLPCVAGCDREGGDLVAAIERADFRVAGQAAE